MRDEERSREQLLSELAALRQTVADLKDIVERKHVEEIAKERESRYRLVANATYNAIWDWDLDLNIIWWNEGVQTLFGYSADEVCSDLNWWYETIHPDDRERVFSGIHAVIDSGRQNWSNEYRYRRADGSYALVVDRGYVMRDETGRPVRMVGAIQDITARRRSEIIITGQKRALELVAQRAPISDVLEVLTRIIEEQSDAGLLSSVLLLDSDGIHLKLGAAPSLPENYNRAIDGIAIGPNTGSCGTAAYFAKPVIVSDIANDPLWADYRDLALSHGLHACWSTPILSSKSKVLGTFAVYYRESKEPSPLDLQLIDILTYTAAIAIEHKNAEDEQQNRQKWLEELLNLAPIPVLLIEPGTARITFANKVADTMAGGEYPKGVPAEEYHTVYYCTDAKGNRIPDEQMPGVRVARGERLENFEMDWHTPLGKLSILLHADTLPAMHNHPATAVVTFQNITQLKQIEAELRRANHMKDEFLSTVSHELRTPLTAMLGWTRLLRTGKLDKENFDHALETIDRNAKAQAQLIEDLLDVSRIITGKLHLDIHQLELVPLIESSINTVRPAADAKAINLRMIYDSAVGSVFGDATRLQQVIWNLLSNAIKFTPKGGYVEVQLERAGPQIVITVSDNGQGISPDFLPHVFDRFRQADGTSTRKHGGLGLGLAIVRHIVELHGGTITVESQGEDKGTTFKVRLPLRAITPSQISQPHIQSEIESSKLLECSTSLEGLRLLIVDDEPDALELIKAVVAQCGAEVQTTASAAEALAVIEKWKPDILVSDIAMPDVDGYELIRKIRSIELEHDRRIPAIALTAYARPEDRIRALSAGFNIHVSKPIEPAELVTVIASLSGRTTDAEKPMFEQ
jgi:PAS domain S-box-containing protein